MTELVKSLTAENGWAALTHRLIALVGVPVFYAVIAFVFISEQSDRKSADKEIVGALVEVTKAVAAIQRQAEASAEELRIRRPTVELIPTLAVKIENIERAVTRIERLMDGAPARGR